MAVGVFASMRRAKRRSAVIRCMEIGSSAVEEGRMCLTGKSTVRLSNLFQRGGPGGDRRAGSAGPLLALRMPNQMLIPVTGNSPQWSTAKCPPESAGSSTNPISSVAGRARFSG